MHGFTPAIIQPTTNETQATVGGKLIPRTANGWTDVAVTNGVIHGTNGPADAYDDSYALIAGDWGNDYEIDATVKRSAALVIGDNTSHEIELNVGLVQTATTIVLTEVLFAHYGAVQIFGWGPGAMSDTSRFTGELGGGQSGPILDGSKLRVVKVGKTVTAFVAPPGGIYAQIAQASNIQFDTGNPGIGFFTRPGGNSANYGISELKVRRVPTTYTLRPSAQMPINVYPFSFTIPKSVASLWLGCTRDGWPNDGAPCVRIAVEYSGDGGVTWRGRKEGIATGEPSTRGYNPGLPIDFVGAGAGLQVRGEVQMYRSVRSSIILNVT